ncbi:hypothetical protein VF21_07760 [Pseudogymnoascus sp. 05NY08]|nr:hypothetical protein VF21_07760 [Pseudogymnoascus sp. 05NY08]
MGNHDEESVQDLAKDYPGPLTYHESPPSTPSQQSHAPPSYDNHASTSHTTTSSPYRQFPQVMNAYYKWLSTKTYNFCGATKEYLLYVAEIHTGLSGLSPLGFKAGVLLHNSMSTKDQILGVAGDNVIMLPPLETLARHRAMTTEIMRPSTTSNNGVTFVFSVKVGEKLQRERFEWRKFKKRNGDEANPATSGSSSKGDCSSSPTGNDCEAVAVLTLTRSWAQIKHPFSLELTGSGLSGALGDRWVLMVVIAALRLWFLNANGRATKTGIAVGEKL